jgi:hypothetical protein
MPKPRKPLWLEFALHCRYLEQDDFDQLDDTYDKILGQLVRMLAEPNRWSI